MVLGKVEGSKASTTKSWNAIPQITYFIEKTRASGTKLIVLLYFFLTFCTEISRTARKNLWLIYFSVPLFCRHAKKLMI